MKETWEQITETLNSSGLNEEENRNVINRLDVLIGSYILENRFPLSKGNLTDNEWVIYEDVVRALNEGKDFATVKNDYQYNKVVKEIFAAVNNDPSKRLKQKLVSLDTAYEDGDWKEVNKQLDIIGKMI
ncbi:hypothetical protein CL634_05620 [bacterium]|nr:hypothetical protein [bacterium]